MSLFPDVSENSAYARAIDFACIFGIMIGDEKGNFNPNSTITRAELCVIICKLFNFNVSTYPISQLPPGTHSWAQPYFNACLRESLVIEEWIKSQDDKAKTDDLNSIFCRYSAHQKEQKNIPLDVPCPSATPDSLYLTRETCADQIFDFCKEFSSKITSVLLSANSTGKVLSEIIQLYQKFDWVRYFLSADDTLIGNVLSSYPTISSESLPDTIQIMQKISDLRKLFLLSEKDSNVIYHYTSLNVLNILTSNDAKFHISNTAYLNDPSEGKLAFTVASDQLKKLQQVCGENDRTYSMLAKWGYRSTNFYENDKQDDADEEALKYLPIPINTVFVASFISNTLSLPMWYQYADKADGCCLGFDISAHKSEFYKVQYVPGLLNKFFEDLFQILYDFLIEYPEIDVNDNPVFRYAQYVIQQISFLYKDPVYSHENEIRYLRIADFKSAKMEETVRNGEQFPRIYLETDIFSGAGTSGLEFESIILGTKVIDPEKISVALAQRGYDPSIIKKSKINFR